MFKLIVLAFTTWGNTAPVQIEPSNKYYSDFHFETIELCKEQGLEYIKAQKAEGNGIEFRTFCVKMPG